LRDLSNSDTTCKVCGKPIIKFVSEYGNVSWMHANYDEKCGDPIPNDTKYKIEECYFCKTQLNLKNGWHGHLLCLSCSEKLSDLNMRYTSEVAIG